MAVGEKDIFRPLSKDDSDPRERQVPQNAKERLYDRIKIPMRALNVIIALLFVAILAFIVAGMIEGNP